MVSTFYKGQQNALLLSSEASTGNPNEVQKNLNFLNLLNEDVKSFKNSHMSAKQMIKEDKLESALESYFSGLKNIHLKSISRLGYLSMPCSSLIRDIDETQKP